MAITPADLRRGQEQFNIFCAVCHGRLGDGNGMIVQRGFPHPPSYHIPRLRNAPIGHFYQVITNGFGAMYSYNDKISPADRWRIAAYIRALQRSQDALAATDGGVSASVGAGSPCPLTQSQGQPR
jgi:mono/diheme cytochrome c family protein